MLRFVILVAGVLASTGCRAAPFDDYTIVQKALIAQNADVSTLEAARRIFPEEQKFLSGLKVAIDDTARGQAVLNLSGKYSSAYFDFIRLSASADVLADFMSKELASMKSALVGSRTYQADTLSWGWSNIARAAILAYQRTGEQRFIDMYKQSVVWAFDNLDSAKSITGDDLLGVDGWSLVDGGVAKRDVTTVGRITAPIIEMANVTEGDERINLEDRTKFKEYADRAVDILGSYLGAQIIEGKRRYFMFPWAAGGKEPANHMAAFAEACAFAYKRTREKRFRGFVEGFVEFFRSSVTVGVDGAYTWPYQVGAAKEHQEYFWKASVVVTAMISIHGSGIYLQERDVRGLANAFDNYVVGEFYAVNAYMGPERSYLTGYNSYRLGYANGLLFPQFILLNEWRRGTKDKVLNTIASRPDLFPTGFFLHSSDAIPYAYLLPTIERSSK